MRVGIEGKVLTPRIGGIGRCAISLVKALLPIAAREQPGTEFVIFTGPQTDRAVVNGLGARFCDRFQGVKSTIVRSSLLLPVGLVSERIDVFHGLDHAGIPFFFKKGKFVVTIYDVVALALPQAVPLKRRLVLKLALARIRRQADVVIVPSESTREDVVRYLKVDRGRIVVIPLGCSEAFKPSGDPKLLEKLKERYRLPDRYILFLGTLEPRKNVATLLKAFSMLLAEKSAEGLKLVIAGGQGWGEEDLPATAEALGLRDHVIFTGFVDEEDLPELYRRALVFVYPSLSEGFGLPILEAMACGTPVIASNTAAIPEVAGDAAILVDPADASALASAMASVLSDFGLREELRRKGIARARGFTWDAVARKTLAVYAALGAR